MRSLYSKVAILTSFLAAGYAQRGLAQTASPSILEIDVQNRVQYFEDSGDPSIFATDPNITAVKLPKNFTHSVIISDIVAVNGQPVTGTVVEHIQMLSLTTAPNPGQAI